MTTPILFRTCEAPGTSRAKRCTLVFGLLAVLAPPALAQQAPVASMAEYMACARSVGAAIHDKFTILPAERSGERGLYVYTDSNAYFLGLGQPYAIDGEAQEFLLRTSIASVGDLFVNFRQKKPSSTANIQPGISYQIDDSPPNFALTPATVVLDDAAREVIRQRLKEKVATIKNFIDDKNSYSTPADAKIAFENDRVVYVGKLQQCRIRGDRALDAVVEEEILKLRFGFPGATVWEKQIGSKPGASSAAPLPSPVARRN
jgi:hypothetical protein